MSWVLSQLGVKQMTGHSWWSFEHQGASDRMKMLREEGTRLDSLDHLEGL